MAMVGELPLNGLPPVGTRRWVARRKASVVAAVHRGLISRGKPAAAMSCQRRSFHPGSGRLRLMVSTPCASPTLGNTATAAPLGWPLTHRGLRLLRGKGPSHWSRDSRERSSVSSPCRNASEPGACQQPSGEHFRKNIR